MSSADIRSPVAPTSPGSLRAQLDKLLGEAETSLKSSEELINKMSKGKDRNSKIIARKIIRGASQVAPLLEAVADVHPVAKIVVGTFTGLIKLELDRNENNEQIAVTCHSMTRLVLVIRYLTDVILDTEDQITELFKDNFEAIATLMRKFGEFSDLYYGYKLNTFRLCFSGSYKERLSGITKKFEQKEQELKSLMSHRTNVTIHETHEQVAGLSNDVHKVISMLGEMTEKENQATAWIAQHGGPDAVAQNDALLASLSNMMGEKINGPLRTAMREDLDQLLEKNHRKIDEAIVQISEEVAASRDAILHRLDAGPHELIEDEDVRSLWKDSEWKMSVKCRVFVDGVHDYFATKFIESKKSTGHPHPDMWTLRILSKVMFHGAIGDAIDADGSGFLSVREVNKFLRSRPSGWSIPQWLAFWAVGWLDNNIRYHDNILGIIDSIESAAMLCQEACKEHMDDYLDIMRFVEPVIMNSIEYGAMENTDPGDDGFVTLDRLREEFMLLERSRITEKMVPVHWTLEDEHALISAMRDVNKGRRVELSIMSLLTLLLEHHLEIIVSAQKEPVDEALLWSMGRTLLTVFYTFNDRMNDLIRGWKQQRKEVSLQINCFAGGLYSGWYQDVQKPDSVLRQLRILWHSSDDTGRPGGRHVRGPDKIDKLMARIASLEDKMAKLATIEDLRVLLTSSSTPVSPGDQGRPQCTRCGSYGMGDGEDSQIGIIGY
ncbi:hypothetical protein PLICRDRAFT_575939 [Plicaturopsis crispa FD-325 SS-3]|nr:hypothetical protein PLICRDRAFT_575939 [Plicaturopsis crispa FD-325 SS-3]